LLKNNFLYIKMKRKYLFLSVFSCFLTALSAQHSQQAESLVNDFVKSIRTATVKTGFVLTITDENGITAQQLSGTFVMQQQKFVLESQDLTVYFDGKTQWTYLEANNEVSITEPSEDELAEINPMIILHEYQDKCNIRFSPDEKSAENYAVEMTPIVQQPLDFSKITVLMRKTDKNLVSMKLNSRNGYRISIRFDHFEKGAKVPDSTFVFDKKKYKNVIENDLR